jgi:endoglucanase
MIKELGFNYVRLPMSYKCWSDEDDWYKLKEKPLKEIDEAVEFGKQYGIHVCINFHRAPGFCINERVLKEPYNLWEDEQALEACTFHWAHFAERYKGIPNEVVSFDLVNEPTGVSNEKYIEIVSHLVKAIRDIDPDRLIVANGNQVGKIPIPEFNKFGLVQATRGYRPSHITHFQASWSNYGKDLKRIPTWPLVMDNGEIYGKNNIMEYFDPWFTFAEAGGKVHVNEWGAYKRTPHDVVLAWMKDNLNIWKNAGWGWAMWCFRGSFGIMDSCRHNVYYENYRGHKLDRKMLELIKEHMLKTS